MIRTLAACTGAFSLIGVGAAHAQTVFIEEGYRAPIYAAPPAMVMVAPPAYSYFDPPVIVAPPAYGAPAPVYTAPRTYVLPRRSERIVVRERFAPAYQPGYFAYADW